MGYPEIAAWPCSEVGIGEEAWQICMHRSNATNMGSLHSCALHPLEEKKGTAVGGWELVSPDSPLGNGEIGAHLCHRQWSSSLCVTLLRHCWYQLVRVRSYTHRKLPLWQRLLGKSRKAGHFLPHPERPWIQSALTATRQDIISVKLSRKIICILI